MKVLIFCLLVICMNIAKAEDLWEVQLYKDVGDINDLQFIGDEGWAVGYSGSYVGMPSQILYTSNLGKQWTKRNPPLKKSLFSVCFIDNKHGWVVGNGGALIYTETGGIDWIVDTTLRENNYRSVYFRDFNQGWVAGSNGNSEAVLLETSDGGKLWKDKKLPYPVGEITKIYFIDSLNGFLLGNNPTTIFRTINGGDTWTYQSFDIIEGINSVHFIDKNNGWICGGYYHRHVGSTSLLLKTSDGGLTWEIRQNEFKCVFADIYFYSNRIGYAVANAPNGIFYKSTDSGINWNVVDLKTPNLFLSKFIPKNNSAWLVGCDMWAQGIIFKGILDLELFSNSENWQRVLVDPNAYKKDGKQYQYTPYPSVGGAIKLLNYGKTMVKLDNPAVIKDINGSSFKSSILGNMVSLNQNKNLETLLLNKQISYGDNYIIPAFFDPKEPGYHRLEIRFDNNSDVEPITVLEGFAGFPKIATSDLNFGNVEVGKSPVVKTVNFNFVNWEYDYPLTITDFVVDNNELFTEKTSKGIFRWDRNNIVDKYGNKVTLPITIEKDEYLRITGEYEPIENGDFSVRLTTVSNAEIEAVSTWTATSIVSSTKDKTQVNLSSFNISPNPASDFITISIPENSNHTLKGVVENGEEKVQIFNTLGIEVAQKPSSVYNGNVGRNTTQTGASELLRIDISHLPSGVYFIKIGGKVKKFVKF